MQNVDFLLLGKVELLAGESENIHLEDLVAYSNDTIAQ